MTDKNIELDQSTVDAKQPTKKRRATRKIPKFSKVGTMARWYILDAKNSSKSILTKCKKKFPTSKIDPKHISWYIWKLKKEGKLKAEFKLPTK